MQDAPSAPFPRVNTTCYLLMGCKDPCLSSLYYRLLGAKIGTNCHVGSMMIFTHDLLTVGDNCSIGNKAKLHGYKVEDGWLKIGSIQLGHNSYVGSRAVIGPELVTVDEGGFIASDVAIAWPPVYGDTITFALVTIGKKAFLGNTSSLPAGKSLGDGGVLGSLSITPEGDKAAEMNTAWLGSPAVFLPKRESFVGYSDKETFNLPKKLYCIRLAMEFVRIIIPTTFSLILLFNLVFVMEFLISKFSWSIAALILPAAELVTICALVGILVAMKWIILGRLKPLTKPIWDIINWKNDIIEFSYACFMVVYLVGITAGTPFALWLHRLLGTKVGKRVFSDTSLFSEFDLISIGDDVCLNSDATLQPHLYGAMFLCTAAFT